MQGLHDLLVLLFHSVGVLLVLMQEAFQIRVIREYFGTNEVQQSEQLLQVVLQRSSSNQQSATGREGSDDLGEYGVDVLDTMCLVNGDIFKREFLERGLLDQTQLVSCDADLKVLWEESVCNDVRALLFPAAKESHIEVRGPFLELSRPILEG